MNFDEALAYMGGLIRFGPKPGLDRFRALCRRLGDPQDSYRIVHVTGTKGKGSTTALCAGILRQAGFDVGAYLSPYVYDVRERVQVNGEMIPHDDFARLVTFIRPHIEALAATDLGAATEFELKTALGFLYFAERKVDYACIEVGIGGRLDMTNVVKPVSTVITNVALDHVGLLGDTPAAIAREKAGILKPGVPCVTAADDPDALRVIETTARERNVPLMRVLEGTALCPTGQSGIIHFAPESGEEGADFAPDSIATSERLYPSLSVRMAGRYQRVNAACAVASVEAALQSEGLDLPLQAVREGLEQTSLPGRFKMIAIPEGPTVILDGAHNALSACALAGTVRGLMAARRFRGLTLVIGMLGGHEPGDVLSPFVSFTEKVIACQPRWKRALSAEMIAAEAQRLDFQSVAVASGVDEAVLRALREADKDTLILVTGSFYTVGEVDPSSLDDLWQSSANR